MRDFTVPATVTVSDDARLTDMVVANAREVPDQASFSRRTGTGWEDVTAAEFAREVDAVGTLTGLGRSVSDEEAERRRASVRADDLATIIYTSGTRSGCSGR